MAIRTLSTRWSALALATAVLAAPVAHAGDTAPPFLPRADADTHEQQRHDRFIVTYRDGGRRLSTTSVRQQLASAAQALGIGIQPVRTLATGARLIHTDRMLDAAARERLARELARNPDVLAVEPDRRYHPLQVPNDEYYSQQWHYRNGPGGINAESAWDLGTGTGVVVAVLDTGSTPHSELVDQYAPGYDFISDPFMGADGDGRDADANDPGDWHDGVCDIFGRPSDSSWHGTHVAGTIAAETDNSVGVAGVAFGARAQPVRVLGRCGGQASDMIDAIAWASGGEVAGIPANPTPAEVINLSLGGGGSCLVAVQQVIDAAVARGTTVVVAAGNSADDVAGYSPASCDNVITVAATGPTGLLADYSNFGMGVELAAPGGTAYDPAGDNILSTSNTGARGPEDEAYAWSAGTSMAAPQVAGVVALMQAASVAAGRAPRTPAEITEILVNTAYASGGFIEGCNTERACGSGIVDARYAVAVAAGLEPLPDAPPPIPQAPPPVQLENGSTVTGITFPNYGSARFQLEVPNGAGNLLFIMSGGEGNGTLYVRHGAEPTETEYDCRPSEVRNEESCFFPAPQGGTWYVRIVGFEVSGVVLHSSFIDNNWPRGVTVDTEPFRHRTRVAVGWEAGERFIDVYRDGALLRRVRNNGGTSDVITSRDAGTATYAVCNSGTDECADPVTVEYDNTGGG